MLTRWPTADSSATSVPFITDFVSTKSAMNGTDVADESAAGQRLNNGILQYMRVERRGNYLLPPRELRALPPAEPA